MFKHSNKFKEIELSTEETNEGRFYITPNGKYESITTALSKNQEKQQGLERWRKNVGEKEANRILRVSSNRGTSLHNIAEKYLKNDPSYLNGAMPDAIVMFKSFKHILDESINEVYLQEAALYSDKYKLAGRVDFIGRVINKITTVDFKNSRKPKKREWIEDYFLQISAYSFMFKELYGVSITQAMILIAVENSKPQIFLTNPSEWETHDFFRERLT
jgi:hypothetical protein